MDDDDYDEMSSQADSQDDDYVPAVKPTAKQNKKPNVGEDGDDNDGGDDDDDGSVNSAGSDGEEEDAANDEDDDANGNEDDENDENENDILEKINKPVGKSAANNFQVDEEDGDDDENDDEDYLQKFDDSIHKNVISEFHPELQMHNNEEIECMCRVVRDEQGVVIDPLHRTVPFITKYEKARVLGERAKQINSGAKSTVAVEPTVIDGYLIALKEYEQKKIPFIVKRPLPSGGVEYWKLEDLEELI
jgi:DNA-directed RNA polymerase I, II, and III subunit RPABC2